MADCTSWIFSGSELVPRLLPALFSVSCPVWTDWRAPEEVMLPVTPVSEIVVEPKGFWI